MPYLTDGLPDGTYADLAYNPKIPVDTYKTGGATPQQVALPLSLLGLGPGGQTTIAAAGASQGNATAITSRVTIVTVTASTQGVKLPTATTGLQVMVMVPGTKGVKVYPFSGDKISTAATNVAVALVADKANIYRAIDAVTWAVMKGA